MYEPFDKQVLTSSSHLTVSQNIELRNLLNECNRMATNGNLNGWRWKLDAIERELYFDLKRLDKDNKDPKTTFEVRIKAVEKDIEILITTKPKNMIEISENKRKLYRLLSNKEIILRELQEKSGKGTKRTYDDSDDDE